MKKLFAVIGISVMSFCAFLGGTKKDSFATMYAETESSQVESSSEPQASSSEQESQEPIDIDKETKDISDTAKDVIAVIKNILTQKIVIAGVSISLGALLLWVAGKVIVRIFDKRADKYQKKLDETLKKLGQSEEQIAKLKQELEMLDKLVETLANNTKNIQVKEKLLAIYNENKDKCENIKELVVENKEQLENVALSNENKIKEILEK